MDQNSDSSLKDLWRQEIASRRQAQNWNALANAGFIGTVATELPEFFEKQKGKSCAWRVPLFFTSGASIVIGVIMSSIKGNRAEAIRESALINEHSLKQDGNGQMR